MGFMVSASTGYPLDNGEVLRNAAKNILNNKNASPEATQKIIEKTLFNNSDMQMKDLYTNPQLAILKASTQISINKSLKETLKYLSSKKIAKKHVLGELWNEFKDAGESSYDGELYDFEIDKNAKNIFAA